MNGDLNKGRRSFLKNSGKIIAGGGICGVFPSCATAQSDASADAAAKAAEAEENAKFAAMMDEAAVKSKRREAWHKFRHNPKYQAMSEAYAKGSGKWKIHMLGTSCGSEPLPDHNHTSWILENPLGEIFWFDAGEYCSWTAHNMGIDILRCKNVFLSHPHIDHTLGLAGIFASIFKMRWINEDKSPLEITVHTAVEHPVKGAKLMINSDGNVGCVKTHIIKAGEVYSDKNMVVDAIPNNHMAPLKDGTIQSYSYRIKMLSAPKKTIVFSGDIKNEDDLEPFFKDGGIDLLMIETGHHVAEKLCKKIKEKYPNAVKDIMFVHHGVEILDDPEFEKARADAAWGKPVIFSADRQTVEL